MQDITIVGLKNLDPFEIEEVENISEEIFKRFKRDFKNKDLVVTVRKIKKGKNSRGRFEFNLRIDAPTVKLTAKHEDYELERAFRRAFDNLIAEANHKFKDEVREVKKKRFK